MKLQTAIHILIHKSESQIKDHMEAKRLLSSSRRAGQIIPKTTLFSLSTCRHGVHKLRKGPAFCYSCLWVLDSGFREIPSVSHSMARLVTINCFGLEDSVTKVNPFSVFSTHLYLGWEVAARVYTILIIRDYSNVSSVLRALFYCSHNQTLFGNFLSPGSVKAVILALPFLLSM